MLEDKFVNYAFIFVYLFERFLELSINHYNKAFMVNKYFAKIKFPIEALQMKVFHALWFVALIIETSYRGSMLQGFWFNFSVSLLILAQCLRWYAIYTLGVYWSVDIYEVKDHPIVKSGPYAYTRHPNYIAVLVEFIFLPLLLGCTVTMVVGFFVNLLVLKRRIALEEQSLHEQSHGHYV